MPIVVGIDAHKDTHTAVAVDEANGIQLAEIKVAARSIHRIAVTQIRIHEPAKALMARKITEGKSKREALRCLKPHIARKVFNIMKDQANAATEGNQPVAA